MVTSERVGQAIGWTFLVSLVFVFASSILQMDKGLNRAYREMSGPYAYRCSSW